MTFNYALEKKKFDAAWESLRKFYTESGMEPEAIEAMHEYDWDAFKAARIEALHTQELVIPEATADDDKMEEPLVRRYADRFQTEYDTFGGHSRYWWIDELTTPCLTVGVPYLTDEDKELLTMYVVDGLTTREIAKRIGITHVAVSQKLCKLFNYFK